MRTGSIPRPATQASTRLPALIISEVGVGVLVFSGKNPGEAPRLAMMPLDRCPRKIRKAGVVRRAGHERRSSPDGIQIG